MPGSRLSHQVIEPRQLGSLHLIHQGIDIGIVEIERPAADPGQLSKFPDRDLPQTFLLQQRNKRLVEPLFGHAYTAVGVSFGVHRMHRLPRKFLL